MTKPRCKMGFIFAALFLLIVLVFSGNGPCDVQGEVQYPQGPNSAGEYTCDNGYHASTADNGYMICRQN
jgi:hypothetical protein